MRALYPWRRDGEDKVQISLHRDQGHLVMNTLPALWRKELSPLQTPDTVAIATVMDSPDEPMSPPRSDRAPVLLSLLSKEQQVLAFLHTSTIEKLESCGSEVLQPHQRKEWIARLQAVRLDLLDAQLPREQLEAIRELIWQAQLVFA
eukprot:Skav212559  [mRNA]  locus=scaffold2158:83192:83632:+ [translate_table: standard]